LRVDVVGALDLALAAASAGVPGPALPVAPEAVPAAVVAVLPGAAAAAMAAAVPPARAPATIVAPSSLDMVIAANLLGVDRLLARIVPTPAKRTRRAA
jgi:hypothetical protein